MKEKERFKKILGGRYTEQYIEVIDYYRGRVKELMELIAQSSGIVPGIQKGGGSEQALLEPGELVVPRQSFSQITQSIEISDPISKEPWREVGE